MSNDYFNHTSPLSRHTLARASAVNAIFNTIATGFGKLPDEVMLNQGRVNFASDGGTANTYTATMPQTWTSYVNGATVLLEIGNTNTGASTLNVDGLGARSIKTFAGADPVADDLEAGKTYHLVYDASASQFKMLSYASQDTVNTATVADNITNVNTVAGISGNVTTVAGISADVTTVAAEGTDIGTVAGISADVSTVAGISADVSTVAADGTDIGTVATDITNVNTVATNIVDVNTFANRYRIASSAPATNLDAGDLYFNTSNNTLYIYDGAAWLVAAFDTNGALIAVNNLSDLDNAGTARTNLGLGSISTQSSSNVSITGGSISDITDLAIADGGTGASTASAARTNLELATISQAEAEAGTATTTRAFTAQRVKQAIAALQGLSTASTSGAAQTVDFGSDKVHISTIDNDVTFTFSNPRSVSKVDLILDVEGNPSTPSNWSYDSVSFSFTSQEAGPQGMAFKPDGTKMYIIGIVNETIYQYSLSTAWDISTASYDSVFFDASGVFDSPGTINTSGITFKPDGTKMYLIEGSGSPKLHQLSLSTAWDVSTATDDSKNLSTSFPQGLYFNDDGTQLFVASDSGDEIRRFTLSTAWDISTGTLDHSYSVTQDNLISDVVISDDGSQMWVLGSDSGLVMLFDLSTPFAVNTASFSDSIDLTATDSAIEQIEFNSDKTKAFILGRGGDAVYQFSTPSSKSVTFPSALEAPTINITAGEKTAVAIVTADGGTSYQAVSVTEGIV